MFFTVQEVAALLHVKPGTIYAWAKQGKIPCVKLHRLVRFPVEAIQHWLASAQPAPPVLLPKLGQKASLDLAALIARAKAQVYTRGHGETRLTASPSGKEEDDGAR
jgi:excisionase family DNA binding protein